MNIEGKLVEGVSIVFHTHSEEMEYTAPLQVWNQLGIDFFKMPLPNDLPLILRLHLQQNFLNKEIKIVKRKRG